MRIETFKGTPITLEQTVAVEWKEKIVCLTDSYQTELEMIEENERRRGGRVTVKGRLKLERISEGGFSHGGATEKNELA